MNQSIIPGRTYVAIVLDKSGSMDVRRSITISGFNEHVQTLIEKGNKGGDTFASLILFNDDVTTEFFNVSHHALREITEESYKPFGSTAMYDAIGYTLDRYANETDINDPNNAYLVIIISDGEENASKIWTKKRLPALSAKIKELQNTGRWTFTYVGCNQDLSTIQQTFNFSDQNVYKGWTGDDATSMLQFASGCVSLDDYLTDRSEGKMSKTDYFK